MTQHPLCFVLMPFGTKRYPATGPDIDFNRIYQAAIRPAVKAAGMQPLRSDEEEIGGIIHKAMFEKLLVCSYAVADLTTSNPNVLYELGVRHTARPGTTLTVYAKPTQLPFDVRMLSTQPYALGPANEFSDAEAAKLRRAITRRLKAMHAGNCVAEIQDSPVFELVPTWKPKSLPAAAVKTFRKDLRDSELLKGELDRLHALGQEDGQTEQVRTELAEIRDQALADQAPDAGVLVKLILVHRSIDDWSGMIEVYDRMPKEFRQIPIREQTALAYNRRAEEKAAKGNDAGAAKDRAAALALLDKLGKDQGATPETLGLLGRIYKSQWLQARATGDRRAGDLLVRAVDAYVQGFETDWREIYPGINALTLLAAQGDAEAQRTTERLLPVVRFAAEQRVRGADPDYWDYATMVELEVLHGDLVAAERFRRKAVAVGTETWQRESTTGNLRIIESIRRERQEDVTGLCELIDRLAPGR
ncbi:DUF4071 domain-containing protein [Kribbella sp. NBC_00709]|uniref:TRAFs-binding domain-containing protein n=1 Tax=Kribbella sp. NBC_00709 TaxID=2975972 RepID=UPI002E2AD038|nr:TRAFs-binding domain-containing protein [Kribbella sp. NBC_00709]